MTIAAATPVDALEGIRVVDISGPQGNYCGKLFADMGADVILVEPPGGSALRRQPPFIDDRPDPEGSLAFAYANTSKRGIVLDLDQPAGQQIARRLIERADLVIETERPGAMAARHLGYADCARLRPSLVYTSITLAGQSGPWANFEGDDLIAMALGGMLSLSGYFDGEPVAAYGQQAYAAGSLFGAVASLMAILEAERTGEGDFIDVSIQEAVVLGMENAAQYYDLEGSIRRRYAGDQRQAGSGVFPCQDGHVLLLAGGVGANRFWKAFTVWMQAEGVPEADDFAEPRWVDPAYLKTAEAKALFLQRFGPYAATRTKQALYEAAKRFRVPFAPVSTPSEVLSQAQLAYRNFFVEAWHEPSQRVLTMPGAPYRLSATPWRLRGPAPRLGEHNAEVFAELGLSAREIAEAAVQVVFP